MKDAILKIEKGIEHEFIGQIKDVLEKTEGDIQGKLHPSMLPLLADIAAIYSGLAHLEHNYKGEEKVNWLDDIADELNSATEKYNQFKQSNDPILLEMSRDELRHALNYINRWKMSNDPVMRAKVPEYQKKYEELVMKINSPHGAEKLPRM